jgi:UDP-N-acetylmuramoyl-L-alanyl-D-glutamate--2,6-diaminopimelate ligase
MMVSSLLHGMRLSTLLRDIVEVPATFDRHIEDLTLDSRAARAGSCFIALAGHKDDGARYAADAIARGAIAVQAEHPLSNLRADVPVLHSVGLRQHLGTLANRFFDTPSMALKLCAVTGTNGKTTVAHLLAQAVELMGDAAGYIGTLGAGALEHLSPLANTTPDIITINRHLAASRDRGCTLVALEASSHALAQQRLAGLRITAGAFTNLGHDHLDYHIDLDAYGAAKRRLFAHPDLAAVVLNIDDALGAQIALTGVPSARLWTCSSRGAIARLRADGIVAAATGMQFTLDIDGWRRRIASRLIGRFNVDNLLIVCGLLLASGYEREAIVDALPALHGVSGRAEECGQTARGARLFVDYAHTPDSLAAILATLRELAPRRIVVVFGCGGGRDRSKRPVMGAIAERDAERVIITADNPRDEDAAIIAAEIRAGMRAPAAATIIVDRALAIRTAIAEAGEGDFVLIAGKGHERTQESAGHMTAFSDHAEIARVLAEAGA